LTSKPWRVSTFTPLVPENVGPVVSRDVIVCLIENLPAMLVKIV